MYRRKGSVRVGRTSPPKYRVSQPGSTLLAPGFPAVGALLVAGIRGLEGPAIGAAGAFTSAVSRTSSSSLSESAKKRGFFASGWSTSSSELTRKSAVSGCIEALRGAATCTSREREAERICESTRPKVLTSRASTHLGVWLTRRDGGRHPARVADDKLKHCVVWRSDPQGCRGAVRHPESLALPR